MYTCKIFPSRICESLISKEMITQISDIISSKIMYNLHQTPAQVAQAHYESREQHYPT